MNRILILLLLFSFQQLFSQSVEFSGLQNRSNISFPIKSATGTSVAIEGDYAVVGIPDGGISVENFSGMAIVYKYDLSSDEWVELKTLTPSQDCGQTYFGFNVEIHGDLIVVSEQPSRAIVPGILGKAYIFQKDLGGPDNWGELKFIDGNVAFNGRFGLDIALSDSTLALSEGFSNSISIYDRDLGGQDNWGLSRTIPLNDFLFSRDLKLEGDRLFYSSFSAGTIIRERNLGGEDNWGLVKNISQSAGSSNVGLAVFDSLLLIGYNDAVSVFKRDEGGIDNYGLIQTIISESGTDFGIELNISDSLLVIAQPGATVNGLSRAGRIHLYDFDPLQNQPLTPLDTFVASTPVANNFFGMTVDIAGDQIVTGAERRLSSNSRVGRAIFLGRNVGGLDNWGESLKIEDTESDGQSAFGLNMDIDGDLMIASAQGADTDSKEDSGGAYLYHRNQGGANAWGEVKYFTSPNPGNNQRYGKRVKISGDIVSISENGDVYIYYKDEGGIDNWGLVKSIQESNELIDILGNNLAIVTPNNTVNIYNKDEGGVDNWGLVTTTNVGFITPSTITLLEDELYIGDPGGSDGRMFHFNKDEGGMDNWGLVELMSSSVIVNNRDDDYGSDLSIYNDLLVVTSQNTTSGGLQKVFVFEEEADGFEEKQIIDKLPFMSNFGRAIAMTDRYIITGDPASSNNEGLATLYQRDKGGFDKWGLVATWKTPKPNGGPRFTSEVAIADKTLFINSVNGSTHGIRSGSILRFEIEAEPFITEWNVSAGESLILPTSSQPYRFDYKWVLTTDTTVTIEGRHFSLEDGDFTTSFTQSGNYRLEIDGFFPHLVDYPVDNLVDIVQWGSIEFFSMARSFKDWLGTSFSTTDAPDLKYVTDFTSIFEGASNFNGDLSAWEVDSIKLMSKAFADAIAFDKDIGDWDVHLVTHMDSMFAGASVFNQDISEWPVEKVETMSSMFRNADAFNQPIGNWDVKNVDHFDFMFLDNDAMNQNLGDWLFDESDSVQDVFQGATVFDCENWSRTIIGWHVNNLLINNVAIGGPAAFYDETAAEARDKLVLRGWAINGNEISGTCIDVVGKYWTGDIDSDWDKDSNWFPEEIPVTGDSVIILQQINMPTLESASALLASIYMKRETHLIVEENGQLSIDAGLADGMESTGIFFQDGSTFTNRGKTTVEAAFDAMYLDNITTTPVEIVNEGLFIISNGINSAIKGSGLGGNLTNGSCAVFQTDAEIGAFVGRLVNDGLINYLAQNYAHDGSYIGNNFRFDPLRILPAEDSDNNNPTYLDFILTIDEFTDDRDGDGVSLCEGDHPDDLFTSFNTIWNLTNGESISITPVMGALYDYRFYLSEVGNADNLVFGAFSGDDSDHVITPPSSGNYELKIIGDYSRFRDYDKSLLTDVSQWGDIKWSSMSGTFVNWPGSGFTATDAPDLTNVGSMQRMFFNATNFNAEIGHWDVSNVKNMQAVFNQASSFNGDISSWDIRNVTNMRNMFRQADAFNQDIGKWDVSGVINMTNMFENTASFNQDIGTWKFNSSVDLTEIVRQATGFGCDAWTNTLIGWNFRNLEITNQNLGMSGSLDFDAFGKIAHDEMEARGWSVPGSTQVFGLCTDFSRFYWTGSESSDWDDGRNWLTLSAPTSDAEVYIPFQDNQPILNTSTPLLKRLEIFDGAILSVAGTGVLNLED